jgi:CBS domain containing-hemolysin-like protein
MDEATTLSNALEQMIRENAHIACVTGPGGTIVGLLTLEDVMEELVGNIGDEYDRLPTHLHALAWGWIVGGGATMQQLAKTVDIPADLFPAGRQTVAAWCESRHAGRLRIEDVIRADGLEVQVRKMRRGHVMEALVRRADAHVPSEPS